MIKMNKNILIGILVLFVVVLGYYAFSSREKSTLPNETEQFATETETNNYFAQNQECLRHKEEIAYKLETKDSPFGKASLEQIFYSPKVNSCLYVEYTIEQGFYNKRLMDIRNDGYSSDPLTMCSAVYPLPEVRDVYERLDGNLNGYYKEIAGCDNFDEELKKYR
jgi:hypothetical protein